MVSLLSDFPGHRDQLRISRHSQLWCERGLPGQGPSPRVSSGGASASAQSWAMSVRSTEVIHSRVGNTHG